MLNTWAATATKAKSLDVASQSAGANNGGYVDISSAEGEVLIAIPVGAVTGSVIVKVQDADGVGGANVADLAGVATASYSTANSITYLSFPASSSRPAIRVVATVTTGPIIMGCYVLYMPKYI